MWIDALKGVPLPKRAVGILYNRIPRPFLCVNSLKALGKAEIFSLGCLIFRHAGSSPGLNVPRFFTLKPQTSARGSRNYLNLLHMLPLGPSFAVSLLSNCKRPKQARLQWSAIHRRASYRTG